MRFNFPLLFIILSLSIPSLGETMDDVVQREGLIYKKFTDIPFTGEVEGNEQGSIKNGKRDGPWISYHDNGQLENKINYKDGEIEGPWVLYYDNGQLASKGEYKDSRKEGTWVKYWGNGQLWSKINYKDGEIEGPWVEYRRDGSINEDVTGTYKNGEKISD